MPSLALTSASAVHATTTPSMAGKSSPSYLYTLHPHHHLSTLSLSSPHSLSVSSMRGYQVQHVLSVMSNVVHCEDIRSSLLYVMSSVVHCEDIRSSMLYVISSVGNCEDIKWGMFHLSCLVCTVNMTCPAWHVSHAIQ